MPKTGSRTPCLLFISGVLLPSLLFRTQLYDVSKWSVYSEGRKLSYRFIFRILKHSGVLNSHPFKDPDPWLHFTSARLNRFYSRRSRCFWFEGVCSTEPLFMQRQVEVAADSESPVFRIAECPKKRSRRLFGSSALRVQVSADEAPKMGSI